MVTEELTKHIEPAGVPVPGIGMKYECWVCDNVFEPQESDPKALKGCLSCGSHNLKRPILFLPEDFICEEAWYCLIEGKHLDADAFNKFDDYLRYLTCYLDMHEGTIINSGGERQGKSMAGNSLAMKFRDVFGKRPVLNYYPNDRFGSYIHLDMPTIIEETDRLEELQELEGKLSEEAFKKEVNKSKLCFAFVVIDEGFGWAEKSHRTALSRLIGGMARMHGHFHSIIMFISQDARDADARLIYDRRTHTITATKDNFIKGHCTAHIVNRRTKSYGYLHFDREYWGQFYKSDNMRAITVSSKYSNMYKEHQKKKAKEEKNKMKEQELKERLGVT